jgi:D-alanyl-D-alanine carboxypeptidase
VLAVLIVQAATGRTLGHELTRRIFRPLGLRDTFFPINRPDIPGRNARGYGQSGEAAPDRGGRRRSQETAPSDSR